MSRQALDLISKLGAAEAALPAFISPVFYNDFVITRLHGLMYKFRIAKHKPGWYEFEPEDFKHAKSTGTASLDKIDSYLKKMPKVYATACMKHRDTYIGVVGQNNPVYCGETKHILLPDDGIMDFDRMVCRFDGANLWYHQPDMLNDPVKADYLRNSLSEGQKELKHTGLLFDEKAAYSVRYEMTQKYAEELEEVKLRKDVEFAGGKFIKYSEKSDHYSVTYSVDGQQYTSYVSKNPSHSVITAGICLDDTDDRFDLKSLITVMREGQRRRLIYRFHNTEE